MSKLNHNTRAAIERMFPRADVTQRGHLYDGQEYVDRRGRVYTVDCDPYSDTYLHIFHVATVSGEVRDSFFREDWDDLGEL